MARNQQHIAIGDQWRQLTNDDVTHISFQALEGTVYIRRGTQEAPTPYQWGWMFNTGLGRQGISLDQIAFGEGQRVWARSAHLSRAAVLVDHA